MGKNEFFYDGIYDIFRIVFITLVIGFQYKYSRHFVKKKNTSKRFL